MFNIKDILAVQGFKNDDLVRFGIKDATMPKGHDWKQKSYSIDRVIRELGNQKNHLNYYISHARHSGGKFTKKNFSEIVEMVIDIDYGPHHNQESEYDTKSEALAAAMKLPKPTLVIHTGGGLQVHYRFRNRLQLPECRERFEQVTDRLGKHIGADSCYATGHTFRLAFTKNHKPEAPVRDVEIEEVNENIDYTLEEVEQWCTDHGVKKYTKATPKTTTKRKRKMKRKKKSPGRDRSALAFREIERIIRKHPEIKEKEVYNHLKDKRLFNHYVAKNGRKLAREYFRRDFKRCKYKLTNARIPIPPNEVVKLKYEHGITEELNATRNLFYTEVFAPTTPSLDISLSLMEELYLSGEKSILNFPCASGKTTAAMILAANYSSPKNRMWIVTQKVKDVKKIAENLRKIGANALEWHGWNDKCPTPREKFMKKKAKESCSDCQKKCTAHHKYLSKTPWDNEDCDILVTTHSHWQATVSYEKFSPSVKFVIVDEAPGLMEYFTIDDKVKKDILSLFQYDPKLSKTFKTDLDKAIDTCADGGCHRIASFNCLRKRNEINQYIHKLQEKEEEQEEEISSELLGLVKSFINFFNTEEIYGMTQRLNWKDKTTFIRGEVDLRTNVPHMVLDGSALMNDVYWEGFKIYECDDLKQKYSNTTIDVVDDNPSKVKLRTRKSFDSLLQKVKEAIEKQSSVLEGKDPVVIFSNKELSNDKELSDNIGMLYKMVNEMGLTLIDMFRGEHIGSNRAQKAVLCAIGMSLFNDISYYVLRTALVTHSEIDAGRIWKTVFGRPSMKNGGFTDFEIQQTYCRSVVVDLYQTIMRGCVRAKPDAHYNVVCMMSGPEIFQILSNELEGATFNYEHSEVVRALLQGKSDTEILKEHDIKRNSLASLKAALNLS